MTESVGTTTSLLSVGRIMQEPESAGSGIGWQVGAHYTEVVHQASKGGPSLLPQPQGHYLMKLIVACHYLPGTVEAICHTEADNRPFPLPDGRIALSGPDSFI